MTLWGTLLTVTVIFYISTCKAASIKILASHDHKNEAIKAKRLLCCTPWPSMRTLPVCSRMARASSGTPGQVGIPLEACASQNGCGGCAFVNTHQLHFWRGARCSSTGQLASQAWRVSAIIEEFTHDCVI